MRPQRKIETVSKPTVIVRKKKPQRSTSEALAQSGKAPLPTKPVSPLMPLPDAKPYYADRAPRQSRSESSLVLIQPQSVTLQSEATAPRPNRRQRKAEAPRELLEVLRTHWPAVFPHDRRSLRPLMRGVHKEIARLLPGTALWVIKRALILFQRLSGDAYWQAVLKGGPRYGLDGSPCGEVTPREQEHARQTLATLAQRRDARRQAAAKEREPSPSAPA